VESQAVVVVENTLLVRLSARVATRQYFTNLVVVAELREIFESLYMVGVVAKYTVEGGVAILQTTHVDRNDSYSRLEYKPQAKVMNSTEERKYMIKAIRYVDEVITYTDVDKIVKDVDFDVFVTGPDQCHEGFQKAIRWCEENGKEHIVLGRTDGISSSELKAKIAAKTAASLGKNNTNPQQ
jgi:glycerol-3-phosphate cytidylyltransferase-like family protein